MGRRDHSHATFSGLEVPAQLGKYNILFPLAAGGMATVHLARAGGPMGFERLVALKVPHKHLETEHWTQAFAAEARLASRIAHPNVVRILDVDQSGDEVFLVMEYVEGASLSDLLRMLVEKKERMPIPMAVRILVDMLAGLQAAHDLKSEDGAPLGIIHRDVSPQNVLVGIDGITRLTDFGIAKATDTPHLTKTGVLKGKIGYLAPEQIRDEAVDRRADIWSAGVVAWELFAGRRLFQQSNDAAIMHGILSKPPMRLSEVVEGIPPAIDHVVASALALDSMSRYGSAEAFSTRLVNAWDDVASREELGRYVENMNRGALTDRRHRVEIATGGVTPSSMPSTSKSRSPRAWLWVAIPAVLLLTATAGYSVGQHRDPVPAASDQETTSAPTFFVPQASSSVVPAPLVTVAEPAPVLTTASTSEKPPVSGGRHNWGGKRVPPRPKPTASTPSAPLQPNPYGDNK